MATYNTHLTVSLVGVLSLGLLARSSIAVTDAGGPNDSSNVLGDVATDRFTAPTGILGGNVDYTYLGTVRDASGTAVGFAASSGILSDLVYTVFLPTGVDPTQLSLTLLPTSSVDEQSRWDLTKAAAVDTTPPAIPTIGTVGDNVGAIQGAVANGASTDDTTLTLTGTAEAGSTVRLYNNGTTLIGTATAAANGSWTVTTSALSEGAVALTARATDAAGNTSGASTVFAATIDTLAPTVLSVAASGSGITAGNGTLNAGKVVTLTLNVGEAVTVTGTPTLALNSGGAATYVGGSGTGTLTFTHTVAEGQTSADLAVTGLNLPGGALIRDAAGNPLSFVPASTGNPSGTLRIDTSAPAAPISLALAADTGASSTDRITADPTITGIAEAGATVVIRLGATVVGTGTANAVTGAFSIVPSGLAQGANTLAVTAIDAAGNTGLPTAFSLT